MIILILHPDPANEASFVVLPYWIDVEDQTTNFAQELAPNVLKIVVLAIEAIHVQVDHLQEALREKFRREEASQAAEYLVVLGSTAAGQRFEFNTLRQLGAAQKILVAIRH